MASVTTQVYTSREDRYLNHLINNELDGLTQYKSEGSAATEGLIKILKDAKNPETGKKLLSIARHSVCGSIGKGSSLGRGSKPDYDVVIYFNVPDEVRKKYTKPNLEDMPSEEIPKLLAAFIKTMTNIAFDAFCLGVRLEFSWAVCVQVEYRGFKFDLVPAINFRRETRPNSMHDQWIAVLTRCAKEKAHLPYLASSMSKKVVKYVKDQEPFTARVVILAKLWVRKCVTIKLDMCARSTVVELIAIKVGQEEVKKYKGEASITRALEKFLEIVAKPRSQVQIILSSSGIKFPAQAKQQLVWNEEERIVGNKPMLIDPVNPFFNYLQHIDGYGVNEGWKVMRRSAERSLAEFRKRPQASRCEDYLGRTLGDYSATMSNSGLDIVDLSKKFITALFQTGICTEAKGNSHNFP